MKKRNTKTLSLRWFAKADDGLLYARAGFNESKIAWEACFDCQQAAEKYLKGFLVSQNVKPPRIHDLPKLLDECTKIKSTLKRLKKDCEVLNRYYNEARYPGDILFEANEKQAEDAFARAESICKTLRLVLNQIGYIN